MGDTGDSVGPLSDPSPGGRLPRRDVTSTGPLSRAAEPRRRGQDSHWRSGVFGGAPGGRLRVVMSFPLPGQVGMRVVLQGLDVSFELLDPPARRPPRARKVLMTQKP
jgi:hypothetical protein